MALNWNLSKIKDSDNLCWHKVKTKDGVEEDRMNGMTETLIFLCAGVGIGEITAKNAEQFHCRVNLLEQLNGPFLHKDGKGVLIAIEDIKAHIGLSTNVSYTPKGKWLTQITRQWRYI